MGRPLHVIYEPPPPPPMSLVEGRQCGGCTMCCKSNGVPELEKPTGTWCQHCAIGRGCGIYEERPHSCRIFKCAWLMGLLPEDCRPDRTKVVLWSPKPPPGYPHEATIHACVDAGYPDALTEGRLAPYVKQWQAKGEPIIVFVGKQPPYMLLPDGRKLPMHETPGRGWECTIDKKDVNPSVWRRFGVEAAP